MGNFRLSFLSFFAIIIMLAGCNLPASSAGNPVQTAVALTLAAVPEKTPTPTLGPDLSGPEPMGKIVYVCQFSKRSGVNQICLMNADGSDQQTLTPPSNADNFFPSIAPDGASVLFASDRSGRYQIYELVLETDELAQLTDFDNLHAYAPAVSPNGEKIVFYARRTGVDYPQSHNLWVMNRDGSDAHAITTRIGGAWDPAWSPDGQYILFASQIAGKPQLFIVEATGNNPVQVTNVDGIRGRNDWAADGITLSTYIGLPWDRDIFVFDLAGENMRQLSDGGNNLAPSFSPNGKWLVFMSYRDNVRQDLGCEIYIMRVDGTEVTRLTDNDICDWQPRWGN
jgi:TolB protein